MESRLGSEERQAELAGIRASLAEAARPKNVSGKELMIAADTGHAECIKLLLADTAPEYARSMETAMGSAQDASLAEMMRWAGGEEIQGSAPALSAQNENGARQGRRGASFWAEETESERELGKQRIVDEVLRNARAGRAKPATADLESAVLAKDLASTIAWVASGKRWASKINVFSKRAAEAEHAMSLAAAMGWTEGLRVAGSFDMGSFGAWSRSKRLVNDEGREMWVPMAASTRHGEMKGWREDGEDRENRELSAMGFAAINKNVDALKFMTRRFRVVAEKIGPIQNGPIPAGWVFRKANKGAVGPYAGMDNAMLFSIMAGDMGSAKALAMAGAGSPGLGEELAWAAKHSLPDVATMLVEVDPQSKALKGAIGQNLLSLSIDKGRAELARMLLDLGVDSSKFMIHGMSLAAVVNLSKAECLAAVAAGGEDMGERARRSLLAFARAAESRKALPAPMASRSEDLGQKNNENNGGELASKGSSEESVAAGEEGLLPERSQARKAKESMGGDNGYAVSEAMRELEGFEAIAGQMGGRIRALIAGLQDGAQDAFSEPPKTIGATVRKMRERAEAASQAIAKASSTQGARREP